MKRWDIIAAYTVPAILALVVFVYSRAIGDPATLIVHKVIFAPIFLLAAKGLRQYFPEALDESRSIATVVEFQLLNSALLAVFVVFVAMPVGMSLEQQITFAFVVMCLTALGNILLLIYSRRESRKKR